MKLKERLLDNTTKDGTCLIWKGLLSSGYPVAVLDGRRVRVRRLLYTLCHKKPPLGGMVVRSVCNRRDCINPDHLCRGSRVKGGNPFPREGVQRRYPWDRWFEEVVVTLQEGDYNGMPHSFAQMARNAAHERGLRVSIRINGARVTLTVIRGTDHAGSR